MRAMTWWDHNTGSIWSQPWGMAIDGPLRGTQLDLIPAGIVPWATWFADHPDTQVLVVPRGGYGAARQSFSERFVIGIALAEYAKAYPFKPASEEGLINDRIGPFPVVLLADAETKAIQVYLRKLDDTELEFTLVDGRLRDQQTGSSWDVSRGIAVDGPLKGTLLRQVPYSTAFDWAWEDFYPHSEFYGQAG